MSRAQELVEQGLAIFEALVGEDPELEEEFQESQSLFSLTGADDRAERALATRRHLEWFLLERPSDHLGGVPAEVLMPEWHEQAREQGCAEPVSWLESFAGVFEVTSVESGRGLWATDLFGRGEYPIEEPNASLGIEKRDLLVGRVFPIGEGLFSLSPAAYYFRDPALLSAVCQDLERMRGARRGVLRIEQLELERLFFSSLPNKPAPDSRVSADAGADSIDPLERCRADLRAAGLDAATAGQVLTRLAASGFAQPELVIEILNQLAFDTSVDLEEARRALTEAWGALAAPRSTARAPGSGGRSDEARTADEVRAALDAFDRGRASGGDLDELLARLAGDLGVEPDDDGLDADDLPDFPGVVGAMVEEFLWDAEREQGAAAARRLAGLRRLSGYAANIGVFENLGRRDLLDFAGRWLLDEGDVADAGEADEVLAALEEFCAWCESRQAHPLVQLCGEMLERLRRSVPRLASARRLLQPHRSTDAPWDVVGSDGSDLHLRSEDGRDRAVRVTPELAAALHEGDLVHAREGGDSLVVTRCYPAELRELLRGVR